MCSTSVAERKVNRPSALQWTQTTWGRDWAELPLLERAGHSWGAPCSKTKSKGNSSRQPSLGNNTVPAEGPECCCCAQSITDTLQIRFPKWALTLVSSSWGWSGSRTLPSLVSRGWQWWLHVGLWQVTKEPCRETLLLVVVFVCLFMSFSFQTMCLTFFFHFKYYLSPASKWPPEVIVQIIPGREQLLSKSWSPIMSPWNTKPSLHFPQVPACLEYILLILLCLNSRMGDRVIN